MNTHAVPTQKKRLSQEQRAALQALRDARDDQHAARLKGLVAQNRQLKRTLREQLNAAPNTVPGLAERTGIPSHEVLRILASMRKYGEIRELDLDGDYPRYELIPES